MRTIASSSPRRIERNERRAFDQIVARGRETRRPFGMPSIGVARSADALQERGDPMRRSDLADQIDVADVDAQLERRGRDERAQRAALQRSRRRAASPSTGCRDAR